MDVLLKKNSIRSEIKRHRSIDDNELVAGRSELLAVRLRLLRSFHYANTALLFWPLPGEVDLRGLIESTAKRIVLPVVVGDNLILREYSPEFMSIGKFGIHEPDERAREVSPEEIDFAVIPGVAFDRYGNRLGRGKGFYDRLLPALHCPKCGVAFSYQIFDDIPVDPWDIPMDVVVTESAVFQRNDIESIAI